MHCDQFVSQKEFKQIFERAAKVFCPFLIKGRLVLKKSVFFCVGEYAEYGFDQQRLTWYVFRVWDMVFS